MEAWLSVYAALPTNQSANLREYLPPSLFNQVPSSNRRVRAPVVRAWAETDQKAVPPGAVDLIGE